MSIKYLKDIDLIINSPSSPGGFKSLDANNEIIANIGYPVNSSDASNKQFVLDKIESFFEFAAYYNSENLPITARIPNYQPVSFNSSPFFSRNNPVTSVSGSDISLPAGNYISTYSAIINDDSQGNNDANFVAALRVKNETTAINGSLSGFNVSGSHASIPYTNYHSFFFSIAIPIIAVFEISVDSDNWSIKNSSIYISFRKV